VIKCAICGQELPTAASEFGDRERPCCLADWTRYLAWQERVNAVADTVFDDFAQRGGDEIAAMVLTTADYLTFVEPDDTAADVLDQFGLLPAHSTVAEPVGPPVMDSDRSPQHREAGGW
jgi:hypothetical protein